ncbi:MAG TPA: pitrilysin family protein [Candidatus Woesebacteria bacterium]|nr:pitrilysin family protein [Candidatus Woesebacteria bacterium]HNS65023.1 pitrilysin family protein [Candidatus Woesebacteria bacterium]
MLKHSVQVLDSGLELIRIPMASISSVTALVLGNTGSRYEKPAQQGLAHFFEHMVFKGTKKYPDPQVLASTIDAVGAQSNAFTSKEYTGYYVKAASKHLERSLDVLSDMLLQPLIRPEDIEREKGVIIEEINMYSDSPMQDIDNVFDQLLFENESLGHDVIGTKETVSGMTHQDFLDLLSGWYGLPNLTLVLAGDATVVESDQTLDLVSKLFGGEKRPQETRVDHRVEVAPLLKSSWKNTGRLLVKTKQTEQAHLMLGWPGLVRSDERRYALALLSIVLGGNMSSRLFTEVREKRGLCYYVHSTVDYYHDAGVFGAAAGVDPRRIHEAVQVIVDEFQQLSSAKNAITQQELDRAREFAMGTLVLSLEDSQSVAQYYGVRQLLQRKIDTPDAVIERLKRVTLEEINLLAQTLLKSGEMRLALIGPFEQAEFEKYV